MPRHRTAAGSETGTGLTGPVCSRLLPCLDGMRPATTGGMAGMGVYKEGCANMLPYIYFSHVTVHRSLCIRMSS